MITVDTNVFIYAADDNADLERRRTAARVLARLVGLGSPVGLQVVGEFQNSSRRKLGLGGEERARQGREMLATFATFAVTRPAVEQAITEAARGFLSYWDALLIASAGEAGCHTLLSEDMGDGKTYLGVRVVNPFVRGDGRLSEAAREVLGL